MEIKWKKLKENAIIPTYAHGKGDSGFDFHCIDNFTLQPGDTKLISTGLVVEIPEGYEMQIRCKSGLSVKNNITIINSPGTIDASYRGEIKIILHKIKANQNSEDKVFKKGDKIAQGIICEVFHPDFKVSDDLTKTERNAGGFGSTGD